MSTSLIKGTIASPGIKIGKAFVIEGNKIIIPKYHIREDEVQEELDRFEQGFEKTREEIIAIQKQIANSLSNDMSDIFMSHLMMLEDPMIVEKTRKGIAEEKRNAFAEALRTREELEDKVSEIIITGNNVP